MSEPIYRVIDKCRVCSSKDLVHIHDFGIVPLADKLTDSAWETVPSAPLNLMWCNVCTHLQIAENISPKLLFNDDYPYYSSLIPEVASHFKKTYEAIIARYKPCESDLIIEMASNDGVLLKHFVKHSENILGIEPSFDHVVLCNSQGIPSIQEFFNSELAVRIKDERGRAKLMMANNVLAHVPNPYDFAKGLSILLDDDGLIIIEVPHSLGMINKKGFDVIFHQHFSYFSLHSLVKLFNHNNLFINRIEKINTQGGSFRLFIGKTNNQHNSIQHMLKEENRAKLQNQSTYEEFSNSIANSKKSLCSLLKKLKSQGKMIAGYGAPGKAATMLNYFGIDYTSLEFLVDISDSKQGKFFPDTRLEIYAPDKLHQETPDFLLILAWNYADSIMESLKDLKEKGMQFILPYPVARVI